MFLQSKQGNYMNNNLKDKIVLEALLERFSKRRLPRLLDIQKKVELGSPLDDFDMEFLEEVFSDARENEHYMKTADDELKMIIMKALSLYKDITQKALENERKI